MKKISLMIVTSILIVSCSSSSSGGDDDGTVNPPEENKAPSKIEALNFPTNNLLCTTNVLDFNWDAVSDPDGDNVTYVLEISRNNQFSTLEDSFTVTATTKTVTLEKGVAFYWRVKAVDSKNLSGAYSDVYQFYTEGYGETNHLPFSPQMIAPEMDALVSGASTSLQWDANDVDNDPLTYDVYFDTVNPPVTKIGDNQTNKSSSVDLNASTTYYWKVVVKDDKGGQALGQVWSFSTN